MKIFTFATQIQIILYNMLIINIKDDESIDRALKRYKRKFQLTGTITELRRRKVFTKPSVERRNVILNAEYRQQKYGDGH
jgi:small subunit ribosomal protein S21